MILSNADLVIDQVKIPMAEAYMTPRSLPSCLRCRDQPVLPCRADRVAPSPINVLNQSLESFIALEEGQTMRKGQHDATTGAQV